MAKANAVSLPRVEKTGPIYGSSEDSIVFRLSGDFDEIIEKIESLRLARDVDNRAALPSLACDASKCERSADRPKNLNETIARKCSEESADDDSDRDSNDSENSNEDSENDEDECLVERGPTKSRFASASRDSPYWSTSKQTATLANDEFDLDYNTTVDQILQDKDYNEKLSVCLDQLQGGVRKVCSSWSDGKGQAASEASNFDNDFSFEKLDESSEDTLLKIVSSGLLQPAQSISENTFLASRNTANDWQESQLLSGSESPGSSPICSVASVACAESPQIMRPNFTCSPLGSPGVSTTYRQQQLLSSSSSNSPHYFSSSSNQSYADSPSPNATHQVPIVSQLGRQLDEDFESFSLWNNGPSNVEFTGTSKPVGSIDRGYVIDTIDNNELQLVEEILRDMGEVVTTTKNENSLSYGNVFDREACLRENSCIEEYLPHLHDANSNVRSDCNGIAGNAATKSNVSEAHRNVSDSAVPGIEVNQIPADAVVPSYSGKNGSPVAAQKLNWPTEPETNAYSNISETFVFIPPLLSSGFSSPAADVGGPVSAGNKHMPAIERRRVQSLGSPHSQRRRNSDRSILPWPSFNLPRGKASERLKEKLNPKEVERAMGSLLKHSVEELAKQDQDGNTLLMDLVGNPENLEKKKAYLVPLVERLSTVEGALSVMNDRGEDALYLAAIHCPQFPYVTGYLAASMLQKEIDVSQRLYHTRGDTLIHSIATQGDTHGEILAELLALKSNQGNPVFDLSKRNYDGRTALHVAIESHDSPRKGISSVATVQLLLKYGADPKAKETKCGDTALHMAVSLSCDPALVKVLLSAQPSDLVNATNYNQNTPLHLAATVSSSVALEKQKQVCWLLTQAGGQTNMSNRQGKTPLALVSAERKDAIRRIFYKRS